MVDLAGAVTGRTGWSIVGTSVMYSPTFTGWSARIMPFRVPGRSLDRLHISIIDPTGVARRTCVASIAAEAVRLAEATIRAKSPL